jgi:hypothetical protein
MMGAERTGILPSRRTPAILGSRVAVEYDYLAVERVGFAEPAGLARSRRDSGRH